MSNINETIKTRLIKAYHLNKLAHFFIIEPNISPNSNMMSQWTMELMTSLTQTKKIENHEDVLILSPTKEQYQLDQINEIIRFLNSSPTKLDSKFVIINHGDKLKELHLNRLLKTFEEPHINGHIFLINNSKKLLLETINSRAITIRLNFQNEVPKIDFNFQSLSEFEKYITSEHLDHYGLLNYLDKNLLQKELTFKQVHEIADVKLKIEEDIKYNNSFHSIAAKVFHLLTTLA